MEEYNGISFMRKGYVGSSWPLRLGAAAESELVEVPGPVFLKVCFGTQDHCLGVKEGWSSYVRTTDTSSRSQAYSRYLCDQFSHRNLFLCVVLGVWGAKHGTL